MRFEAIVVDNDEHKARLHTPTSNTTPLSRLSLKHVLLYDWWLAWADGASLAVSGFECRGGKLPRVFNSAKISKIDDASTLETVDGITVNLSGILNWSRTLQNGFPHEVCHHFLNGFPHYWESYASQSCEKFPKSSGPTGIPSGVGLNKKSPFPASLLNLHVTRVRDLMMFQPLDSEKLVADMLENLGSGEGFADDDESFGPSINGNEERKKEQKDDLTSEEEKVNDGDLFEIHPNICPLNAGITTRSMTRSMSRLKNLAQETIVSAGSRTRSKKARKS